MLTCLGCHVTFASNENQKEHYKSEWHRYNLMRKVVDLEAVSYEFFLKVQKSREAEASQQNRQLVYSCTVCRKQFNSNAVLQQHFQSKKHRAEVEKQIGQPDTTKSDPTNDGELNERHTLVTAKMPAKVDSINLSQSSNTLDEQPDCDENDVEIDLNECLFCPILSESLDDNLKHMSIEHSFFVNDLEYCCDLEGLIEYLAEKIKIGYRCIFCADTKRGYQSLESVQQHMISKGHCKMKSEAIDILEWSPFYDYSETYPDKDAVDDIDEEFEMDEAFQRNDWELVLPSGAVIGHRSLHRIYRQKYNPRSAERAELAKQQTPEDRCRRLSKLMNQYAAIGYKSAANGSLVGANQLVLARQKARDIKFFYRLRQGGEFLRTKKVKNIASQPHYRAQIPK